MREKKCAPYETKSMAKKKRKNAAKEKRQRQEERLQRNCCTVSTESRYRRNFDPRYIQPRICNSRVFIEKVSSAVMLIREAGPLHAAICH